ncbi:hypothetical protein GFY24_36120 [Nocardia sp. SYP-A9097]|uniref:hypothetical protein n=1 Tax=Nocardia sp. SYP-A9097 TaxID=2663237 RepID=UPI00129C03ED|nr:hypothetical protein [Nocardia sp. SYP-A9097]MRH92785.1 hypothetical protein [Nocardia sp. SYP-A9097]
MNEQVAPTAWESAQFGELALEVRAAVWEALQAAHLRAVASQEGSGLSSNDAYGLMWLILPEELAKALSAVTLVRTPRPKGARYCLTVLDESNLIIYPWKYGDTAYAPLESAKMNLSEVRKRLLALGTGSASDQLSLDHAAMSDEEIDEQFQAEQDFLQDAADAGRLIVLAFASNPHAGVLRAFWGDASLGDGSGRLEWSHVEEIPLVFEAGGGESRPAPARPLTPVPGPDTNTGTAARFDQAPLEEFVLSARNPAVTPDGGQPSTPDSETGSDD